MQSITSVSSFSYYNARNQLEQSHSESAVQLNTAITYYITSYIQKYIDSIRNLSQAPALANYLEGETSSNHSQVQKVLRSYLYSFSDVDTILFVTNKGDYISYPQQDYSAAYRPQETSWYKRAIEESDPIVTEPYYDEITGKFVITIASKILDSRSQKVGVIRTNIDLNSLAEQISQLKAGKEGYPVVLTSNGIVVSHPNEALIGKKLEVGEENLTQMRIETQGSIAYTSVENDHPLTRVAYHNLIKRINWIVLSSFDTAEQKQILYSLLTVILTMSLLIVAVAILAGIYFIAGTTKAIKDIESALSKAKEGDLTVKAQVRTTDELGMVSSSFNRMSESIRSIIVETRNIAKNVLFSFTELMNTSHYMKSNSEQIAITLESIALGAQSQAVQAEHTFKVITHLDSSINKLINFAQDIAVSSVNAEKMTFSLHNSISELAARNNETLASTSQTQQVITLLNKRCQSITQILNTIQKITAQTHLLSLNASIEAARAEEAGRGFVVVAEEVRKLSDISVRSTHEIEAIINSLQAESANAVIIMDQSITVLKKQDSSVHQVTQKFDETANLFQTISDSINNIMLLTDSILDESKNSVDYIQTISAISEETASSTQEISSSLQEQTAVIFSLAQKADSLRTLAHELMIQLEKFKI